MLYHAVKSYVRNTFLRKIHVYIFCNQNLGNARKIFMQFSMQRVFLGAINRSSNLSTKMLSKARSFRYLVHQHNSHTCMYWSYFFFVIHNKVSILWFHTSKLFSSFLLEMALLMFAIAIFTYIQTYMLMKKDCLLESITIQ